MSEHQVFAQPYNSRTFNEGAPKEASANAVIVAVGRTAATVRKVAQRTAAVHGRGALSVAGAARRAASATVRGVGAVQAAPRKSVSRTAAVSGRGTIAATFQHTIRVAVAVTGSGAAQAQGTATTLAAVTVSSVAGATAGGIKRASRALTISGRGVTAATGQHKSAQAVQITGRAGLTPGTRKNAFSPSEPLDFGAFAQAYNTRLYNEGLPIGSVEVRGAGKVVTHAEATREGASALVTGVGQITIFAGKAREGTATVTGYGDAVATDSTSRDGVASVTGVAGASATGGQGAEQVANVIGYASGDADGYKSAWSESKPLDFGSFAQVYNARLYNEGLPIGGVEARGSGRVEIDVEVWRNSGPITVRGVGTIDALGSKTRFESITVTGSGSVPVSVSIGHEAGIEIACRVEAETTGGKGAQTDVRVDGAGRTSAGGVKNATVPVDVESIGRTESGGTKHSLPVVSVIGHGQVQVTVQSDHDTSAAVLGYAVASIAGYKGALGEAGVTATTVSFSDATSGRSVEAVVVGIGDIAVVFYAFNWRGVQPVPVDWQDIAGPDTGWRGAEAPDTIWQGRIEPPPFWTPVPDPTAEWEKVN